MSKSDGRFTVEQFFDFLRKIFASVFGLRKLCISSVFRSYRNEAKGISEDYFCHEGALSRCE